MTNRNSVKEYADIMIDEMKGSSSLPQKTQETPKGKSLGKELTKAVQSSLSGLAKQMTAAKTKSQMQLNPKEDSLKGWGRALK